MGNETEMIKATVEAALEPFMDLIRKLAGPAAEEVGLSLQDSVRVWRFKRQVRLLQKIKEYVDGAGIRLRAVPMKFLLPAIGYGSLEENDELQDRWAALLANAGDPASQTENLPAFPEILKQLTPADARFLDAVFAHEMESFRPGRLGPGLGGQEDLFQMYMNAFEPYLDLRGTSAESLSAIESRMLSFQITISNLRRVGVLQERYRIQGPLRHTKDSPEVEVGYELTPLGVEFLKACRRPGRDSGQSP